MNYFDGLFLFRAWSVRVFNFLRREGLQVLTAEQCCELADAVLQGSYPSYHGRYAIATELYRGAGMGIYPIYRKLQESGWTGTLQHLRIQCMKLDGVLHESLD